MVNQHIQDCVLTCARSLAAFRILLLRWPVEPWRKAVPAPEHSWEIVRRKHTSDGHDPACRSAHTFLKVIESGLQTSHACTPFTRSTSFLTTYQHTRGEACHSKRHSYSAVLWHTHASIVTLVSETLKLKLEHHEQHLQGLTEAYVRQGRSELDGRLGNVCF